MPTGDKTATHPVVKEKVQDKEGRGFGGVLSNAKAALTLYSDPLLAKNTSASDFTIADLVNYERPISLYQVVPPSDKIRLRPLIRLMFTMVGQPAHREDGFRKAPNKSETGIGCWYLLMSFRP
jgi:type IV secretion system protein VirD4